MKDMARILAINPGSTTTKIAVYADEKELFRAIASHTADELEKCCSAAEQYRMRKNDLMRALSEKGFDPASLSAIAARGGALPPIAGGAYRINAGMAAALKESPVLEHASNAAAVIAFELASEYGIPAFIYDGISVDELSDLARISGMPELPRRSVFHALNSRAVARDAAEAMGKCYADMNIIVAHLGGGITLSVHSGGKAVDIISDDEGPFSPERAGRVPCRDLIDLCYSGRFDHAAVRRMLRGGGGLIAYLGTNDCVEIEARIAAGDDRAELVYESLAYQVAKGIGELATVVCGDVDLIVLTGGLAGSPMLTGWIESRVSFIAPVETVPGGDELEALALGVLRVMRGEEKAREFAPAGRI